MGVGLDAGLKLDALAEELSEHLDAADLAALSGDLDSLISSIIHLAKNLLSIRPFIPDKAFPIDWLNILSEWLSGVSVQEIGVDRTRFIEDALTYRLVWALEALRVRRVSIGWVPDFNSGGAAACVECGVPQLMMAMLVRTGLPSREAAFAAVSKLMPEYASHGELIEWLRSDAVSELSDEEGVWPTGETAAIWVRFRDEMLKRKTDQWTIEEWRVEVDKKTDKFNMVPNQPYRVEMADKTNSVWIRTPDFLPVVQLNRKLADRTPRVITGRKSEDSSHVIVRRLGRSRARWRI